MTVKRANLNNKNNTKTISLTFKVCVNMNLLLLFLIHVINAIWMTTMLLFLFQIFWTIKYEFATEYRNFEIAWNKLPIWNHIFMVHNAFSGHCITFCLVSLNWKAFNEYTFNVPLTIKYSRLEYRTSMDEKSVNEYSISTVDGIKCCAIYEKLEQSASASVWA